MSRWWIVAGACAALTACSTVDGLGGGLGDDAAVDGGVTGGDSLTCTSNAGCDDDNPCTEDVCQVDGACRHLARVGTPCDDGSACTEGETCQGSGACGGGQDVLGSDDPCQVCTCDAKDGVTCAPRKEGDACSDADCCTLGDACLACDVDSDPTCADHGLKCVGSPKNCDDANECTLDECACDGETVTCSYDGAPDGFPCDYSTNDCTTGDSCVGGQCILSPPLDLDDQNPCTEDKCDKGEVVHTFLLTGQCDDEDECTMGDHCELGLCVGGDIVQCAEGPCESSASCVPGEGCVTVPLPEGAVCDDDNPCTIGETCDAAQVCDSETMVDCDDGNPCTADSCDPDDGSCSNTPSTALDGVPCIPTGDACASEGSCASGICVPASTQDCNDGNPCTTDTCDAVGGCVHTPNDGPCDDGNVCTLSDTCVDGHCAAGPWSDAEACNPPPACIEGDSVVNCSQANTLDSDGCCCFAEDPTGDHKSGHVLDLGEVEPGTEIECCVQSGFATGCQDTAHIDASLEGTAWASLATFPTTSSKNDQGAWVTQCITVSSLEVLRYVRGANDACYVDFFECTVLCEGEGFDCTNTDCDDDDPCTTDVCDPGAGCTHTPVPDCPQPGECVRYGFEWVDDYDVPQVGTFDVVDGAIVALDFEYQLYMPDACDDLSSPWCHFPGSDWTVQWSDFSSLTPGGFHLLATSEHATDFYFYRENWMDYVPAVFIYKPVGSQHTTALDPGVTWTALGPCAEACGDSAIPSLDTSFGEAGSATYVVPGTDYDSRAFSMAVQTDGKVVIGGHFYQDGLGRTLSLTRVDAGGTLDTSFDGDGFASDDFTTPSAARALTALPDGRLVAGGDRGGKMMVARLLSDGTLDPSFADDGVAQHANYAVGYQARQNMVVDAAGGAVIAGSYAGDWAVIRILDDGTEDANFGTGGGALIDVSGAQDDAFTLEQTANGSWLVGGCANNNFAVARLTSSGALDGSFGVGGVAQVDITGGTFPDELLDLAVDGQGRIVGVGCGDCTASYTHDAGVGLVRWTSDGVLDDTFGDGGIVWDPIPPDLVQGIGLSDGASTVLVLPSGKLLVGGWTQANAGTGRMMLARYHEDGSLDTCFDGDGYYIKTSFTGSFSQSDRVQDMVRLSDGTILVVGSINPSAWGEQALFKLAPL